VHAVVTCNHEPGLSRIMIKGPARGPAPPVSTPCTAAGLHKPLVPSRRMALYKCVMTDQMIGLVFYKVTTNFSSSDVGVFSFLSLSLFRTCCFFFLNFNLNL